MTLGWVEDEREKVRRHLGDTYSPLHSSTVSDSKANLSRFLKSLTTLFSLFGLRPERCMVSPVPVFGVRPMTGIRQWVSFKLGTAEHSLLAPPYHDGQLWQQ